MKQRDVLQEIMVSKSAKVSTFSGIEITLLAGNMRWNVLYLQQTLLANALCLPLSLSFCVYVGVCTRVCVCVHLCVCAYVWVYMFSVCVCVCI